MWIALSLLVGCSEPATVAEVKPAPPAAKTKHKAKKKVDPHHWTQRTDLELARLLKDTCRTSLADGKPILLEFSAPWCLDCRTLALLEDHPTVKAEYAHWHRVRADVGKFDRHVLFAQAWGVDAIAHWAAMQPTDCSVQPPEWPRLKEGTLELATGAVGPRSPEDVVAWLRTARSAP